MAGRIRTIKPELLESEDTALLSHAGFRLFVGLILTVDDYGNCQAHPRYLASRVFWGVEADAEDALAELVQSTLVVLYRSSGKTYLHITGWEQHQKVDHPGKPRVPRMEDEDAEILRACTEASAVSENTRKPSRESRESLGGPRETLAPDPTRPDQGPDPTGTRREGGRQAAARALAEPAVAHLNQAIGGKYQPDAKQTLADFGVLAKEGFTVEQACAVVDAKLREWGRNPDMSKNLRPSTLFRPSNFRRYVVDVEGAPQNPATSGQGLFRDERDLGAREIWEMAEAAEREARLDEG